VVKVTGEMQGLSKCILCSSHAVHIEAVGHKKATKSIEKQPKLSFVPDPVQTKVR